MTGPLDFRAIIAAERDRQGLTIVALAEASGMTQAKLSDWLAGKKADINARTLARLFDALGLGVRQSRRKAKRRR